MAAANPPFATPSLALPRRAPRERTLFGLSYQWTVLICTVFGTFMVVLDSTIVNIALPKITTVFGVSVSEAQLVVTSYMLAMAVVMPATGFLSDTYGTKRLFLITMGLFTAGSLLCGLAWSNSSLVAFRVIQGLGGGMMSPLGMTMLFKVVPPAERNAVMGLYGLPIIMDASLDPDKPLSFAGHTHSETIRLTGRDFLRLERPVRLRFAVAQRDRGRLCQVTPQAV